jgi:putative sugar O-methyltransferase
MNKIGKSLKNPRYAIHVVMSRLLRINLRAKFFAHAKEYRSDSENGNYASAVINALKNQKAFDNFKRSYSYRDILEHVSEDQGKQYLRILESRADGILAAAIDTALTSDDIGNPIKFWYENYSKPLSPTTLRYLKVASDLKILFGSDLGEVAEIGCGYGGQTLVNDQLLNVKSARLFDLPFVNKLIDRYLNTHLLKGAYYTAVINKEIPQNYNLVISNYAFSELPKKLQLAYIEKVLSKAKRGYLTMNSGLDNKLSNGKLSLDELRELLPKFSVIEEEPLTSDQNYLIVWGYSKELLENNFRILN